MSSGSRGLVVALVTTLASLSATGTAWAGQIVYTHGQDLWVMNDTGGGQRELLSAAQVGGEIGVQDGGSDAGLGVEPNGNEIAFTGAVPPAGGVSCDNVSPCPGLYSLINGKVTRLSTAPGFCGSATVECGGEEIDPAVQSNGNVVFYALFVANAFTGCDIYYCGSNGAVNEEYRFEPLNGSAASQPWPTPAQNQTNGNQGAYPGYDAAIAADPADPTKMAYGGNYQNVDTLDHKGCGPTGDSNCYPLVVESNSGSYNETSIDDSFYYALTFSQDGSKIADLETGDNKGIWVYPSSQSYGTTSSANPSAQFTYALADPDNVSGAGQFDMVLNGLTFVGNNELVFSANYNLWSLPARCWATPLPSNATAPYTSNCSFPKDATQLTFDGTNSAPDAEPAWTSSTTPIEAYGSGPGGSTTLKLTLTASSAQKVLKQKGLAGSVQCNEACAVAVAGGVQIKGSSKTLLTSGDRTTLAGGRTLDFTLRFSSKERKAISKALKHHKKVTAQIAAVAKDANNHEAQSSKRFTVKH